MKSDFFPKGVAIVTGGSGGIGAAIVEAFAIAGSQVVFTYHQNREAAEQVKQLAGVHGGKIEYRQLTLQDEQATEELIKNVYKQYGNIHSVIYASGPGIAVDFAGKISIEDWKNTFEHDTHACFNLVHSVLPVLKEQGGGSICAVTTTQATRHLPLSVLSSAPKAAIESLIEVVAKENGRYGIRANCIRSGWLAGGKLDRGMDGQMNTDAVQKIAEQVPLGCLGSPDDIAEAAVFLSSAGARYISGVNLAVDGGWHL